MRDETEDVDAGGTGETDRKESGPWPMVGGSAGKPRVARRFSP